MIDPVTSWAHYYADAGCVVVPVQSQSKKPAMGNGWQHQNDNTLNIATLQPGYNIGIRNGDAGKISIVDIDLDSPEAIEAAPYFLPPTSTFGRDGSKDSHWEYRVDLSDMSRFSKLKEYYRKWGYGSMSTIAEFRCNPGNQTVFPPSQHTSGELITWSTIPGVDGSMDPIGQMTFVGVDDLFQCYCDLVIAVILQQHIRLGIFHNGIVGVAGWCWHLGWSADRTERLVSALVALTGMSDERDRLKVIHDTYTKGDNGSNIAGYSKLQRAFNEDLSGDHESCIPALREVTKVARMGNPTQLSAAEVFSVCTPKMQEAMDYYNADAVVPPYQQPPDQQLSSAVAVDPLGEPIQPSEVLGKVEPFIPEEYELDIEQELYQTETRPFSYIIEDLLPENEVGFVFGSSGSYKSFLLLDMVMSISYKNEWCGMRIAPESGNVLWCAGEGRTNIADRARAWKQNNMIVDGYQKNKVILYNQSLDLFDDWRVNEPGKIPSWQAFSHYIASRPAIKLVVLDTWSSLFSGDENTSKDVAPTLKRLIGLAQVYNVTFLIVHHKGKDEFNSVYRGSGAMTANSDFHFDISRELQLQENEKATRDSERTGRIIFEDKQQRSSISKTKLFFRPKVVNVHNRFTNFGEQLRNVVMDWEVEGKELKPMKSEVKSTTGFDAIRHTYRDTHIQIVKDIADMFKREKSGNVDYQTRGFTLEELYTGVRSRFMRRGSEKMNNKYNLSRTLERLRDIGLVFYKQEGRQEAILYYYLTALANSELEKLALEAANQSLVNMDLLN